MAFLVYLAALLVPVYGFLELIGKFDMDIVENIVFSGTAATQAILEFLGIW